MATLFVRLAPPTRINSSLAVVMVVAADHEFGAAMMMGSF